MTVKLTYEELPSDVEVVKNDQGRFEPRSSERDVRSVSQTTPELARVVCLAYLNVRAAGERVDECLRGTDSRVRYELMRDQYERACEEVDAIPFPDGICERLRNTSFSPPKHDLETLVVGSLARRRLSAMDMERRRQGELFERKLTSRPGRGLSREEYERACVWIAAEPVSEGQIDELKVDCFQQEETRGRGWRICLLFWLSGGLRGGHEPGSGASGFVDGKQQRL